MRSCTAPARWKLLGPGCRWRSRLCRLAPGPSLARVYGSDTYTGEATTNWAITVSDKTSLWASNRRAPDPKRVPIIPNEVGFSYIESFFTRSIKVFA